MIIFLIYLTSAIIAFLIFLWLERNSNAGNQLKPPRHEKPVSLGLLALVWPVILVRVIYVKAKGYWPTNE